MAHIVRARYENGVLKPLEKLDLKEGEEVEIIIMPRVNVKRLLGKYYVENFPRDKHVLLDEVYSGEA